MKSSSPGQEGNFTALLVILISGRFKLLKAESNKIAFTCVTVFFHEFKRYPELVF